MKEFRPEITSGPWDVGIYGPSYYGCECRMAVCDTPYEGIRYDDQTALNAVPELLDVLKAAREFVRTFDNCFEHDENGVFNKLKKSIHEIDEMHGSGE